MRKKLVYICSPCRGDIEKNIEKAQRYCHEAVELWVYGIENPSEGMRSEIEYAKQHQIPIRDAAELYRNREAETLPIGDALIVLPSHVGHLNGAAAIES